MTESYSQRDIEMSNAYGLKSFGNSNLKPLMQQYNENPNLAMDKTDEVFQKMVDLKENMVENIESLIQRDGKIEIIAEKALNLSVVSNSFHKKSKKLKEQERRKRYCQLAVAAILILIVVIFILYALFGGSSSDDGKSGSN